MHQQQGRTGIAAKPNRRRVGLLAALSVAGLIYAAGQQVHAAPLTSEGAAIAIDPGLAQRDIFDQLVHRLTDRLTHTGAIQPSDSYDKGRYLPVATSPWRDYAHPLPRAYQGDEEPPFAAAGTAAANRPAEKRQAAPANSLPTSFSTPVNGAAALSYGAAEDASASTEPTSAASPRVQAVSTEPEPESDTNDSESGSSGAAASTSSGASGTSTASASAAATSGTVPASSASASASASGFPSASASVSASASSASAPASSSAASMATSAAPNRSSTSRSLPTATPSPDDKQEADDDDDDDDSSPSILSPKNKLFPLLVVGIAAAGILALLLFIAIARAVAHDKMRRDSLAASKRGSDPYSTTEREKSGRDRLTSAAPGMSAARSIRRAITRKKLGSFARRQADGSVLVDVGDEVFAVPAHLAESYRREMIRERRMGGSSGGASKESLSDGPFGKVRPRHLTGGGPDVEDWRAKMTYDEQVNGIGSARTGDGEGKPKRTLSQRLAERLRALTRPLLEEDEPEDETIRAVRSREASSGAYSFDSAKQPKGAIRQAELSSSMPVLTHGSSEWQIRPSNADARPVAAAQQQSQSQAAKPTSSQVPRKPVTYPDSYRKSTVPDASLLQDKLSDLEKQVNSAMEQSHDRRRGRRALPLASELSHERVTLSDGPSPSSSSLGHQSGAGASTSSTGHATDHSSNTFGPSSSGYTPSDSASSAAAPPRPILPAIADDPVAKPLAPVTLVPTSNPVDTGRKPVEVRPVRRTKSIHPLPASTGTYRHRKAQHPSHHLIAERVNTSFPSRQPRLEPQPTATGPSKGELTRGKSTHRPSLQRGQSTTAAASPELYRSRRFQTGPLAVQPQQPPRAAFLQPGAGPDEAARPLPTPPRLHV